MSEIDTDLEPGLKILVIILLIYSCVEFLHVKNRLIFPHFIIGGYFRFLQIGSVIFVHILMRVQGYLEEILEVKYCTYVSKYVIRRTDLVVWNEVLLDNRVLVTSDFPTYCLTWRDT
jgi:hypothetical protein